MSQNRAFKETLAPKSNLPRKIDRLRRLLIGFLIGFLVALLLFFIIGNTIIHYQSEQYRQLSDKATEKIDLIIVLGAKIEGDPLRPTATLTERLDLAFHYWQQHPDLLIITSGGYPDSLPESEATVMKRYLLDLGVPDEKILVEESSTRTAEQFIKSDQVLQKAGITVKNPLIITNDFHIPRSLMLAQRSALPWEAIYGLGSPTPQRIKPWLIAHIREPLAYLNSWLRDYPQAEVLTNNRSAPQAAKMESEDSE